MLPGSFFDRFRIGWLGVCGLRSAVDIVTGLSTVVIRLFVSRDLKVTFAIGAVGKA